MKRTVTRPARGIWSEKENHTLVQLAQDKGQMSWNELARNLNSICDGHKTGKQCRERYRNYANPKLEKAEWKPHEKLLFIVLHQVYGNHWSEIAKCLNWRSDIVIKNYFYCIVRKATKHLHSQTIPRSFLKTSEKFYTIFSVLRYIREYYLPDVKNINRLPKYGQKEHMILNLLLERKITEGSINAYQDLLLKSFQKYSSEKLPIKILLSLERFKIPNSKVKELRESEHLFNKKPLNQLILIKIQEMEEEQKLIPDISFTNVKTGVGSENTSNNIDYLTLWNTFYSYSPYEQNPFLQPYTPPQRTINVYEMLPQDYYGGKQHSLKPIEPSYMRLLAPMTMPYPFTNRQIASNGLHIPFNNVMQRLNYKSIKNFSIQEFTKS